MRIPISAKVAVAAGPTATALSATSVVVKQLSISVPTGNAAKLYIGPAGVSSTTGRELLQGATLDLQNVDLASLYIMGTAGDAVTFLYLV